MLPLMLLVSLASAATTVRPIASDAIARTVPVTFQCPSDGLAVSLSRPTDSTVILKPSKAEACTVKIDTHSYSLKHWLFDTVPDHVLDLPVALAEQQLRALEVQAHLAPVDPSTAPYAGITSAALIYAPITQGQVTANAIQIPPVGATNLPVQFRFQEGPAWLTSTPFDPSNIQKILIKDDAEKPHLFLMSTKPLEASTKIAATLNAIESPVLQPNDQDPTFTLQGELVRISATKA